MKETTLWKYNEEYNFEFDNVDELKQYQAEVDREIMITHSSIC